MKRVAGAKKLAATANDGRKIVQQQKKKGCDKEGFCWNVNGAAGSLKLSGALSMGDGRYKNANASRRVKAGLAWADPK